MRERTTARPILLCLAFALGLISHPDVRADPVVTTFFSLPELPVTPEISCATTVCKGDTATYRTQVECSSYNWTVSPNGIIADGGGESDNYVTIQWQSGPAGTVTLSVSGCPGDVSSQPVSVHIPVIDLQSWVQGPQLVCPGDIAEYRIDKYSGASYTWIVPATATILEGQGTHQIRIRWSDCSSDCDLTDLVEVEYQHCFLGCYGNAATSVQRRSPASIAGPFEVCPGESPVYRLEKINTNEPIPSHWSIVSESGTLVWSSTETTGQITLSWDFPPGTYTIKTILADTPDACNAISLKTVTVREATPTPAGIAGPVDICPPATCHYEIQTTMTTATFEWSVNNGGTITKEKGRGINVKWGPELPYALAVTQADICKSDPADTIISQLTNLTIDGPSSVCSETNTSYQSSAFPDIDYHWTVAPANAGIITAGQGAATVEVIWKQPGSATLTLDVCGQTLQFPVTIHSPEVPELLKPTALCPGEMAIVATTTAWSSYAWQDQNDILISTSPAPSLKAGHYRLHVENDNGCESQLYFAIDSLPVPEIYLGTDNGTTGLCDGGSINLFASSPSNSLTVEWYRNGDLIGTNSPIFAADMPGLYQVKTTLITGCTVASNKLIVSHCEDAGGSCDNTGCTVPPGNEIDLFVPLKAGFSADPACPGQPTSFGDLSTVMGPVDIAAWQWDFGNPASGPDNFSTEQHPEHTYALPGDYTVSLTIATITGQVDVIEKAITIPNLPETDFELPVSHCTGTPLQVASSTDEFGNTWLWDYGDGHSSNQANAWHAYQSPGGYDITLTVTSPRGCTSSQTKLLSISTSGLSGEITTGTTTPVCEGGMITLQAPEGGTQWQWSNGETGSNIEITATGIYRVTVTGANGCTYTPEPFSVNITPAPVSDIRALELDEWGEPFSSSSGAFEICYGESFYLAIDENPAYSCEWSDGTTGTAWHSDANDQPLPPGTHDFSVTITDNLTGCTAVAGPFPVTVHPGPEEVLISTGHSGPLCEGTTVNIEIENLDPVLTYHWNTGETGTGLNTAASGTYQAIATDASGCTAESNEIIIHPTPTASNLPAGCYTACSALEICAAELPDVTTYHWYLNGEEITGAIGSDPFFHATESGDYQVELTDTNGCATLSDPMSIELLSVATAVELQACEGEMVQYNDMEIPAGEEMVFTYQAFNGCDSNVTISVEALPAVSFETHTDDPCENEDNGEIIIETLTGTAPFLYKIDNPAFQTSSEFTGLTAGSYTIEVQDVNHCGLSQRVTLTNRPPLLVETGDHFITCDDPQPVIEPHVLSHAGALSWQWPDGSTESRWQVEQPGTYSLLISDACTSEELDIVVEKSGDLPRDHFYVPNAFSPDGNHINDLFQAFPSEAIDVLSFKLHIFDRWGEQLFITDDPDFGWNGNWKGKPVETGVYTWFLEAKVRTCGREERVLREGDVLLVR